VAKTLTMKVRSVYLQPRIALGRKWMARELIIRRQRTGASDLSLAL